MKILLLGFNGILDDVEQRLREQGHEILPRDGQDKTWQSADRIVVWQETEMAGWKNWIRKVQKKGILVILMQHGRRGTSRIYPPFNEELISDRVCVWGEEDKKRLMSCGVAEDRIYVTGTPVLRHTKPKVKHDGINVVFSPEHWDEDVVENIIVAGALRKVKGINVISKLLEGEHNPREYDNPVVSNRNKPGHLDICIETLQKADVVVAISESTFELLAEIMDIPVIIADIWMPKACAGDDRYKDYHREYSPACERVKDLDKLGDVIKKHVSNPQLLEKQRREWAILDGGMDIQDPVEEIIKVICKEKPRTKSRN